MSMGSRNRFRRFCCAAVAAGLMLAGCGQSQSDPTTVSETTSAAAASTSTTARRASTDAPLTVIDSVCRTVRVGAPPPLRSPVTPLRVQRYASAAAPAAERTLTSLERETSRRTTLQPLISDYRLLEAAYAAGSQASAHPASTRSLARAISAAEQRLGAQARASRLPLCAPFAPGVHSATQR
jgi:hypothetical protein